MADLTITFTPPSPAPLCGYVVKYRLMGETEWITVSPNPTSSPVVITGLDEEATYEGTIQGDCCNGELSPEIPFVVNGPVAIPDFDYLVARYFWVPGEGTDLDTLTGIVGSGIIGTDSNWVGWSQDYTTPGNAVVPPATVVAGQYLQSAGDNTGTGSEAVLMNLKDFVTANPGVPNPVTVEMYAFWYGSRNTGNASFEIVAYKGGTMSKSGFDFINSGGTEVFRQTFVKNVTQVIRSSSPLTSTLLGTVEYDKTLNTATLTP
jgi:hypothetical protein